MPLTFDFSEVNKLTRNIRKIFPIEVKAGRRAMLILEENIKDRTLEGKDVNGAPFKPYSEEYAQFRRESGHSDSLVNLFFFGRMFAAMTHKVTKESMKLTFGDIESERKAEALQSGVSLPERIFFDANEKDLDEIMRELIKPFDAL